MTGLAVDQAVEAPAREPDHDDVHGKVKEQQRSRYGPPHGRHPFLFSNKLSALHLEILRVYACAISSDYQLGLLFFFLLLTEMRVRVYKQTDCVWR